MYAEIIRNAVKEAQRTGKRNKKVFNRTKFAEEFPEFASDPRVAFTPQTFIMDIQPTEAIDVGTLREICVKKGEHPLAVQKALSVHGLAEHEIVVILKQDLEVLRGDVTSVDDKAAIKAALSTEKPPLAPANKAAKPPTR